jgi:hypothetical protein
VCIATQQSALPHPTFPRAMEILYFAHTVDHSALIIAKISEANLLILVSTPQYSPTHISQCFPKCGTCTTGGTRKYLKGYAAEN